MCTIAIQQRHATLLTRSANEVVHLPQQIANLVERPGHFDGIMLALLDKVVEDGVALVPLQYREGLLVELQGRVIMASRLELGPDRVELLGHGRAVGPVLLLELSDGGLVVVRHGRLFVFMCGEGDRILR